MRRDARRNPIDPISIGLLIAGGAAALTALRKRRPAERPALAPPAPNSPQAAAEERFVPSASPAVVASPPLDIGPVPPGDPRARHLPTQPIGNLVRYLRNVPDLYLGQMRADHAVVRLVDSTTTQPDVHIVEFENGRPVAATNEWRMTGHVGAEAEHLIQGFDDRFGRNKLVRSISMLGFPAPNRVVPIEAFNRLPNSWQIPLGDVVAWSWQTFGDGTRAVVFWRPDGTRGLKPAAGNRWTALNTHDRPNRHKNFLRKIVDANIAISQAEVHYAKKAVGYLKRHPLEALGVVLVGPFALPYLLIEHVGGKAVGEKVANAVRRALVDEGPHALAVGLGSAIARVKGGGVLQAVAHPKAQAAAKDLIAWGSAGLAEKIKREIGSPGGIPVGAAIARAVPEAILLVANGSAEDVVALWGTIAGIATGGVGSAVAVGLKLGLSIGMSEAAGLILRKFVGAGGAAVLTRRLADAGLAKPVIDAALSAAGLGGLEGLAGPEQMRYNAARMKSSVRPLTPPRGPGIVAGGAAHTYRRLSSASVPQAWLPESTFGGAPFGFPPVLPHPGEPPRGSSLEPIGIHLLAPRRVVRR